MKDINKKFSVRYFINLVLVDEEDRRYFKQQVTMVIMDVIILEYMLLSQEILLWRKGEVKTARKPVRMEN